MITFKSEFFPRLWIVWANTLNFDGVHKLSFTSSQKEHRIQSPSSAIGYFSNSTNAVSKTTTFALSVKAL